MDNGSRMTQECHVRFCERLKVKFHGPTYLSQYEGRNWRGFHHHASLCIAAYGFLMLERLSGVKKNTTRLKTPALPEGFLPRGSVPDAAARSVVHRNDTLSSGTRYRSKSSPMSVLRKVISTDI